MEGRFATEYLKQLHRIFFISREIDRLEREFIKQGIAHFHVSGAGHESTALLNEFLQDDDWLHLHYRDKALMLARGMPIREFFSSLLATANSHSAGRQMSAHLSSRALNITSIVGPVGNNALHAVGVAASLKHKPGMPIAICCVGDGTTQQGEFLEAVAEAVRSQYPVVFVIEDNSFSISTRTGKQTFFDLPAGPASSFYGIDIIRTDGDDLTASRDAFRKAVRHSRNNRTPSIVLLNVERLSDHTNADDQKTYRTLLEIEAGSSRDPLPNLRAMLQKAGIDADALQKIEQELIAEVQAEAALARKEDAPKVEPEAKAPYPASFDKRAEYRGNETASTLTMREALNVVLDKQLAGNPEVVLFGQDIEDPKGDVFGVTRGLSTKYPDRVRNAALSESTIVGTAVGRALAGQRPVAFLQFADFLPLAYNQIVSEMGSMFWRSNGAWEAPVILMVSCGGYKPGLGPFHAQSFEGMLAHTPGIDVVMPSSAGDAAGLLNAAFESRRPTVFLYPKAVLNNSDGRTSEDLDKHFVHPGLSRHVTRGRDITLVSYGNTVSLCANAASAFEAQGFSVEVIDLRSISPWDEKEVLASARRTRRLIVVHEDNRTVGMGAEIIATVTEKTDVPVVVRRLARSDAHIPFNFRNQLETLPSYRKLVDLMAEVLECEVTWHEEDDSGPTAAIKAIGSGPADENVLVTDILVKPGDKIEVGQLVAVVEATKASVEICANIGGVVQEVFAKIGDQIATDSPLLTVDANRDLSEQNFALASEIQNKFVLRRLKSHVIPALRRHTGSFSEVVINGIGIATGARRVTNEEIIHNWPNRRADEILALTGIKSRFWVGPEEGTLSLATKAARDLLKQNQMSIHDIDLVIAATGTPDIATPSLASRVAVAVAEDGVRPSLAAYDMGAACSGYLYALQQAYDFIAQQNDAKVLIITSEVLSPLLDMNDFSTAILFGDAATASLVTSRDMARNPLFTASRPIVSGRPEPGDLLYVPLPDDGVIAMNGRSVFTEAVHSMTRSIENACVDAGIELANLDLLVPHQANQRIIDTIAKRSGRPALSVIETYGNTSSSSIPLAMLHVANEHSEPLNLGLVAFGGGMTAGAAIVRTAK
ncbi:thiamine pyrophosphate-dependent enzyme [Rhizobium sp. CNPSo 4062]|uniref:thiamine pyrophosphate-dependent enzyme n=1 Tax=Rhizobium sp. CNPSo 4062 TaxID=3021410 RepID=UPI00254E8BEC|nr:thiamine pyrophosphate-dependent enzyme [Rhizobium sp. CNPSo 4062]MDK4702940.1 thiamine pyrophosphate-dependent enzyme [Rhizobium sp. CNPSo 4062]